MRGTIKWRGRELEHRCRKAALRGIEQATRALWIAFRRTVGRQGPPRSRPGSPPKKDTGFGQANIYYHVDRNKVKGQVGVGDEAVYMEMLEDGTRNIAPRPWIRRTFEKMVPTLRRILKDASK
jgi:HK97 gp10 family phage protein